MSGIHEILILAGVVGAILFGPRLKGMLMGEGGAARGSRPSPRAPGKLSGITRLAIVGSIILPLAAAFYFEPWHGNLRPFLYTGLGPVLAGWCAWWIGRGFKKR